MLRTILLGGAVALAFPAFAQAPASHAPVNAGTATTTAHDPLQTQDDATIQSTSTPATNASVAGNVSNTSPGIRAGLAAPTDNCTLATARAERRGHALRGRMARRCAGTDGGMVASSSATGGTAGNWSSGAASAYTGTGGPYTGMRSYPRCSRTVRDSCIQAGRSQTR